MTGEEIRDFRKSQNLPKDNSTNRLIQLEINKHLNAIYNHMDKINNLNNLIKSEFNPNSKGLECYPEIISTGPILETEPINENNTTDNTK